jgi:FPC/CPF motif-containing protein YcgG
MEEKMKINTPFDKKRKRKRKRKKAFDKHPMHAQLL